MSFPKRQNVRKMRGQVKIISRFLATVSLVGHLSWGAQAAPIVLADSLDVAPIPNISGRVVNPLQQAVAFKTTATSLSLSSALIPMHFSSGDSAGTGLTVSLFSDSLGVPGSSLVTLLATGLLPPLNGVDNSSVQFLPSTPFTLAANTTYWIVAASTGGEYGWLLANSAGNGPGFIAGRATSADSGATWSLSATNLAIRVTADGGAAPELSQTGLNLALCMTTVVFALILSRRRQSSLAG